MSYRSQIFTAFVLTIWPGVGEAQETEKPQSDQPVTVVHRDRLDDATRRTVTTLRGRKPAGFPTAPIDKVRQVEATWTETAPTIDGKLNDPAWKNAKRSASFVDLVTGKPTVFRTEVALRYNKEHLFVAYWIEEPNLQAKFKRRDAPIWQDNDVELFIAFDHAYYELELNAHNTLYEGLFVWQSSYANPKFGFSRVPELDRKRAPHQAFHGVGFKKHPRGPRWAFLSWDFPKLQSAVDLQGTLNDPSDTDQGWTVELAIPWSGMQSLALGDSRAIPPHSGDQWRMDFSRFNQYHAKAPQEDSGGWALSHHGVWDSHIPEVFPTVTFKKP